MDIPLKNKFFGIFFYLLYLLAMVKPIVPIIEYYANYDYIAAVLCENKDKPYLECNGKCYLKKQIKKNESNSTHDHNSKVPLINLKDYPVSPIEYFTYKIHSSKELKVKAYSIHQNTSDEVLNLLYRPPQV